MKKLVLTAVLLCAAAVQPARAVSIPTLPFLDNLRAEVVNQQVIASNDVVANKKLLASLKKALTTIDKTKPDYKSGAKALGTLAKNLNRTSVSNVFAGIFNDTLDTYVVSLMDAADDLDDRLASAFPSKAHTSALAPLQQMADALAAAEANPNFLLAVKSLSLAVKDLGKAAKSTDKAEDAPAPQAQIIADVSGALNSSIKTLGAAITGTPLQFNLLGGSGGASGQKTIGFSLQNVTDGTHTVTLVGGAFIITSAHPAAYSNGSSTPSGTATVTYNSANHLLYGTFTFTANGTGPSTGTVTVSGSFSGSTP